MADVLRVPEDVAWTEEDGEWYVARVPQGPIQVLRGSAAIIWEESVDQERVGLSERVARRVDSSVADVQQDVQWFVAQLVERGLLAVINDSDPARQRQ